MAAGRLINANNLPEGATLDLDFTTGRMFAMGTAPGVDPITFDRSGDVETYWTPGMVRTTAADAIVRGGWRYDTATSTWVPAGAQIWGSRTNLLLQSEDFASGSWGIASTVTANAAVAPDGTTTGDLIVVADVGLDRRVQPTTAGVSGSHVFSVFAKPYNGNNGFRLLIYNNTTSSTVVSTALYFATDGIPYGDWTRFYVTGSAITAGDSITVYVYADDSNAVGEGNYFWGAQLEAGSYPGPYIPTTTAADVRSADDATVSTAGWFNDGGPGTVAMEVYFPQDAAGSDQVITDIALSGSDRITMYRTAAGGAGLFCAKSGVTQHSYEGGTVAAGLAKFTHAWQTNDSRLLVNGALVDSDTAFNPPAGLPTLYVGQYSQSAGVELNAHIKSFRYYPRALSTAEMEALTAL